MQDDPPLPSRMGWISLVRCCSICRRGGNTTGVLDGISGVPYNPRMRVALVPLAIVPRNIPRNTERVIHWIRRASREGADLVLFPEAALTGLVNTDDPAKDLNLGISLSDPPILSIQRAARDQGIYVGIGFLEREDGVLYDSAILVSSEGEPVLHYRRISPGWHGPRADPRIYRQGQRLSLADTPWGPMGVLICGDLFDDTLIQAMRALAPRWVWVPLVRSAPPEVKDVLTWWEKEWRAYAARIRDLRAWGLLVNLREPLPYDAFGGTLVVDPRGNLQAMTPPFHAEMRVLDLPLDTRDTSR